MGNNVSYCDSDAPAPAAAAEQAVEAVVETPVVEEAPEEEEPAAPEIKLWTAPTDRRFPSTNQARNCYTRYNEFYKCIKEKGEDAESYEGTCTFYKKCYESLCPTEWIERWEEQREEGTWPGKY
ncbi:hypothetical protein BSKO_00360 [Bryopsis sp. KO-2023]|nr:hypothetical protein BSKO_00360 [Bryopsis sp. KO-2023]